MQRSSNVKTLLIALVLLAAVAAGLMNANLGYTRANPGGNDFIPRWVGTRAVLERGANPYSDEVTADIQALIYGGRAANPGEDQQLFVYPYYTVFFVAPFGLIEDFMVARAAWMTLLELSILTIAFLSLRTAGWTPRPVLLGLFILYSLLWYLAVRAVILGNPAVLVALFITLTLYCIQRGSDEWAGIFLACATLKPQMMLLLLVFIIVWALAQRRVRIVTAFVFTLGALVGVSFLLEPTWMMDMLRQIAAYPDYTLPSTPVPIFTEWWGRPGTMLGWAVTGVLALLLLRDWSVAARRGSDLFLWTAGITLAATFLIGIPNPSANQLALLAVYPLVFGLWEERWPRWSGWMTAGTLAALGVGLWWLFLATVVQRDQPIEHFIMHFPLPVFFLLSLYWMRWWVQRPNRRLPIEKVKALSRL
ncbi:MAG: DUF2029 domain-containing protein [Anaerolineae bacterium]|nr:MAG: DUF2029 domain-containing protein [Anaerolineae bacterium]